MPSIGKKKENMVGDILVKRLKSREYFGVLYKISKLPAINENNGRVSKEMRHDIQQLIKGMNVMRWIAAVPSVIASVS